MKLTPLPLVPLLLAGCPKKDPPPTEDVEQVDVHDAPMPAPEEDSGDLVAPAPPPMIAPPPMPAPMPPPPDPAPMPGPKEKAPLPEPIPPMIPDRDPDGGGLSPVPEDPI